MKKTYIIWNHDNGRSYSSLPPRGVSSVPGQVNRGLLERLALDDTVYVLTLVDGELEVERLGGPVTEADEAD